jgi:hypothetical protein
MALDMKELRSATLPCSLHQITLYESGERPWRLVPRWRHEGRTATMGRVRNKTQAVGGGPPRPDHHSPPTQRPHATCSHGSDRMAGRCQTQSSGTVQALMSTCRRAKRGRQKTQSQASKASSMAVTAWTALPCDCGPTRGPHALGLLGPPLRADMLISA